MGSGRFLICKHYSSANLSWRLIKSLVCFIYLMLSIWVQLASFIIIEWWNRGEPSRRWKRCSDIVKLQRYFMWKDISFKYLFKNLFNFGTEEEDFQKKCLIILHLYILVYKQPLRYQKFSENWQKGFNFEYLDILLQKNGDKSKISPISIRKNILILHIYRSVL